MNGLLNNSKKFLKRNSSTILTCIGAVGVVATAVVTARDTIKAVELVKKKEGQEGKLSKKEVIKTAAPAYIPSAIVGLSTIACIFGAHALNKKTQASLMSAYALLNQSYKEYKTQAKEIYGEDADTRIKEGIAKNHYNSVPATKNNEKQLFFDFWGLEFFESTLEEVKAAEAAVNQIMANNGYVSLSTFYNMLGIECVDLDYEVGWTPGTCAEYGYDHIEFLNDLTKNADGSEFISITMATEPLEGYLWY